MQDVSSMKKPLLIFDFDGTLVNSFELGIEAFKHFVYNKRHGTINFEDIDRFRDLTAREVINHLQIPFYKVPLLMFKVRLFFRDRIVSCTPYPGLKDILPKFIKKGYPMGILTSNSAENVSLYLKHHDLEYFDFVHSENSLFGKARLLKKLLKKYGFSSDEAYYIGDETRDIEAARESNVKVVSVTWGFNSKKLLSTYGPDFLIDEPVGLLDIFE